MSTNDTPPLTDELSQEQQEQSQKAWNELAHHPLIRAFREAAKPAPHVHAIPARGDVVGYLSVTPRGIWFARIHEHFSAIPV